MMGNGMMAFFVFWYGRDDEAVALLSSLGSLEENREHVMERGEGRE
jgi:hypothetical protein